MAVKKTHREELGGGLVIEQNSHSVYLGYVPNDYDEELIVAGENCHFDERIVQSVFCDFESETDNSEVRTIRLIAKDANQNDEIQVTGDDWWNEDASMWKWMADAFNSCITHVEKKIDSTMISLSWKIYQNEFNNDEEQDDAESKIVTQAGHSLSMEDGTLIPLAEFNNDDLQYNDHFFVIIVEYYWNDDEQEEPYLDEKIMLFE